MVNWTNAAAHATGSANASRNTRRSPSERAATFSRTSAVPPRRCTAATLEGIFGVGTSSACAGLPRPSEARARSCPPSLSRREPEPAPRTRSGTLLIARSESPLAGWHWIGGWRLALTWGWARFSVAKGRLYDSGEVSDEPVRVSSFSLAVVVCELSMGDPAQTVHTARTRNRMLGTFETYEASLRKDVHIRGRTRKSS